MTWLEELEEIRRRTEIAKEMGGVENIKRQHDGGKLTVRERIARMLDSDSFHEYGALAGSTRYDDEGRLIEFRPSNFVLGTGRINGRKVVVGGDDFTVRGGAADAAIHSKQVWGEMLAEEHRMPIIRLVDGSGGGGSVRVFETVKATYVPAIPGFDVVVRLMGEVPVVAGCMGSVAGLGAARSGLAFRGDGARIEPAIRRGTPGGEIRRRRGFDQGGAGRIAYPCVHERRGR
jgi:acetyl-CoA carboxylase carboxyltransferase component